MIKKLHTVKEVSEILGINRNKVYDLIRYGHLHGLKLGSMKVSTFELEDFMKRNTGKDLSDLDNVRELVKEEVRV